MKHLSTVIFSFLAGSATGAEWFVSPSGLDTNAGTLAAPRRTIARAMESVQPGDVLYLRGGIYRETLVAARSGTAGAPIRIAAYNGEAVTLSAADIINGPWTATANGIYTSPAGWDLGAGYNQIFVDGALQDEARQPNRTSSDLLRPATTDVTVSSNHTISSNAFNGFGDLSGARFIGGIGLAWSWQTAVVASSSGNTLTVDPATESTWWWPNYGGKPSDTGRGYIYGKLNLLDADGEWHLQTNAAAPHRLHLRIAAGGDPTGRVVEMKRRNWCIDVDNVNYVTLQGLTVRGGAVRLNGTGNILENCDLRFLSHFLTFREGFSTNGGRAEGSGILIDGRNAVIRGCTIYDTAGSGIEARGRDHLITRNHVYNTDYSGTYAAGLVIQGDDHQVTFNTVHDSGRDIVRPNGAGLRILYNDLYATGRLSKDAGVIYSWGVNAANPEGRKTRLAYNWVHDGSPDDPLSNGIYLESFTRNFQVDHNVIWNIGANSTNAGIKLGAPANGHELYHNTLFNCAPYAARTSTPFPAENPLPAYWTAANHALVYADFNNLELTNAGATLENVALGDFRPKAGSPAVDPPLSNTSIRWSTANGVANVPANFNLFMLTPNQPFTYEQQSGQGVRLAGVNDGFIGATPDSGAYERGGPFWRPGVGGWAVEQPMVQSDKPSTIGSTTATLRGLLVSAGLSSGNVEVFWGTVDGGTNPSAWQNRANLGTFSGSFVDVGHFIAGLSPTTLYHYRFRASNAAGDSWSVVQTVTTGLAFAAANSRLSNLSVRTTLAAGTTLITGFVVSGGGKRMLLRTAGPSLAAFGLPGTMADPRIELFSGQGIIAMNDDWSPTLNRDFSAVGAFPFLPGGKDAALVQDLSGSYTLQSKGTAAGTILFEAYDLTANTDVRVINVSARNWVGTGSDVLIAGFVIAGNSSKRVLIRGVGPSLAAFGVTGTLADPKVELYNDKSGKLQENNDWLPALSPTFAVVGAFALNNGSTDAALLVDLAPGSYTVVVSGADGGTGEALVEIYEVP